MPTTKWKKLEIGDTHDFDISPELVGIYVGVENNVGPNNSKLYTIEKEDGEKITFWGSTVLDRWMQQASIGDDLKIVYLGTDKNEKTGRSYKNFEVLVPDTD